MADRPVGGRESGPGSMILEPTRDGWVERERRGNGRPARARRTQCAKCETYELRASRAGTNKRANECHACQVRKAHQVRQEPRRTVRQVRPVHQARPVRRVRQVQLKCQVR